MNNTFAAVKSACESLGFDVRSYSGRAMYGRKCLGIEVDRYTSSASVAMKLAFQLLEDGEEDVLERLASFEWCEDSMGLDGILYLPRLVWIPSEEDEDCDCDEDESCLACAGDY